MRVRNIAVLSIMMIILSISSTSWAFKIQIGDTLFEETGSNPGISWVVEHGWMDLENGVFFTKGYITKGEFAKILSKVIGSNKNLKNPDKPSFLDVPKTNKYYKYIETVKEHLPYEITKAGLKYYPEKCITHQETVYSVLKALNYKINVNNISAKNILDDLVFDKKDVDAKYTIYVAQAINDGLIETTNTDSNNKQQYLFYPKAPVSKTWLANLLYFASIPEIKTKEELLIYQLTCIASGAKRIDYRGSAKNFSLKDLNEVSHKLYALTVGSKWFVRSIGGMGKGTCNQYFVDYCPVNYYNDLQQKVKDILGKIITNSMTDEEKLKAIHDYIVKNTKYDFDNFLNNKIPPESYTAYGVLIKGTGVCNGYAETFNMLAQMAGIPSIVISGEAINTEFSGPHAWNMVKVNNEVRYIDVTWDDPVPDEGPDYVRYDYFLLTEEQIAKDHFWDRKGYDVELLDLLQKYLK